MTCIGQYCTVIENMIVNVFVFNMHMIHLMDIFQ